MSQFVEKIDKFVVMLSVDVVEFHAEIGGLPEHVATEKIGGVIVGGKQFPLFGLGHGGELVHVADHEQLDAAERS